MNDWVGPAIIAAFIAALVSVIGWFVATRQTLTLERIRRQEKTRDFQIALRAEIQSELADLASHDLEQDFRRVSSRYAADEGYSVFVPNSARYPIFEAIVADIYILPEAVIEPVVRYMRQLQVVDGLREDIRAPAFRSLTQERQLELYRDYIDLRLHLQSLAERAIVSLSQTPS